MSLDNLRNWRLGIDVGGTNTDAVIIDGDLNLIAATKSPTTEDVMDGIKAAMHEVLSQIGGDAAANIGYAMLGTTHCTNAIVERKRLNKVAVIRLGAPATTAISCMADWRTCSKTPCACAIFWRTGVTSSTVARSAQLTRTSCAR